MLEQPLDMIPELAVIHSSPEVLLCINLGVLHHPHFAEEETDQTRRLWSQNSQVSWHGFLTRAQCPFP